MNQIDIPENRVVNLTQKNDYVYKSNGKYVIISTHSKQRIWDRMGKIFEYNSNKFYAILQMFFQGAIDTLIDMEQEYGEGFESDERFLLDFPIRHKTKKDLHQGVIVKFKPDLYANKSGIEGNQVIFLSVLPPKTKPYFLKTQSGDLTYIKLTEKQVYGDPNVINERVLKESINDKNLFKVLITGGSPGSGKSFVVNRLVRDTGARVISSDKFFEFAYAVQEITGDPDYAKASPEQKIDIKDIRKKYKSKKLNYDNNVWMSIMMQTFRIKKRNSKLIPQILNWIDGMLPIIIDGSGKNLKKIKTQKEILEAIGYDVSMILVNTDLEVALDRNEKRARTLSPEVVKQNHKSIQNNIGHFMKMWNNSYGDFIVIDNSEYLEKDTEEWNEFMNYLYKISSQIFETPLKNPKGVEVIRQIEDNNLKYYSDLIELFTQVQNDIQNIKL